VCRRCSLLLDDGITLGGRDDCSTAPIVGALVDAVERSVWPTGILTHGCELRTLTCVE